MTDVRATQAYLVAGRDKGLSLLGLLEVRFPVRV